MITVELEAEVAEFLEGIATREGVKPVDLVIRACAPLLGIEPLTIERMREVEEAADIEPGSMLDSIAEGFGRLAGDPGELFAYLDEGWDLSDSKQAIRENLEALVARWAEADAAVVAAVMPKGTEEEHLAHEKLLAEIIEKDRPANERAKKLPAEQTTLFLDADLVAAAEAHFPSTEYGSLQEFIAATFYNMAIASGKVEGDVQKPAGKEPEAARTYVVQLTASEAVALDSVLARSGVTPEAFISAAAASAIESAASDADHRNTIRDEASGRRGMVAASGE